MVKLLLKLKIHGKGEKMKKICRVTLLVIMTIMLCISISYAFPVETKPRVFSDVAGQLKYDAINDVLYIDPYSIMLQARYQDDTVESVQNTTNAGLAYMGQLAYQRFEIGVDSTGNLYSYTPSWSNLYSVDPINEVKVGKLTDPNPDVDGIMLTGKAIQFSYDLDLGNEKCDFYIAFDPVAGQIFSPTDLPGSDWPFITYICKIQTDGSGFKGQWDSSWVMDIDGTKQFPTPEPSTLILLGLGLLGVIGVTAKREIHK